MSNQTSNEHFDMEIQRYRDDIWKGNLENLKVNGESHPHSFLMPHGELIAMKNDMDSTGTRTAGVLLSIIDNRVKLIFTIIYGQGDDKQYYFYDFTNPCPPECATPPSETEGRLEGSAEDFTSNGETYSNTLKEWEGYDNMKSNYEYIPWFFMINTDDFKSFVTSSSTLGAELDTDIECTAHLALDQNKNFSLILQARMHHDEHNHSYHYLKLITLSIIQ